MGESWSGLDAVDPAALGEARLQAHHAVQWPTRLARANLLAAPDDSHSNLGWDEAREALVSHPLAAADGRRYRAGLALPSMRLLVLQDEAETAALPLDGKGDAEAGLWLDRLALARGLRPAGAVSLPYVIPTHPVAAGAAYALGAEREAFAVLARWYGAAAEVLQDLHAELATFGQPSLPRCWPHHFDIATLLTLGRGAGENAATLGIGMSPGDEYYAEPYFYLSPWPAPPPDRMLPPAPAPGHWHRRGFTAAVATAAEILPLGNRRAGTRQFIAAAVHLLLSIPG